MAVQGGALVVAVALAALTSRTADWQPAWLLLTLTAFTGASMALALTFRGVRVNGAFSALVLAMVLLGPAPAVLIGLLGAIGSSCFGANRLAPRYALSNLFTYATFPLIGGVLAHVLRPHVDGSDVTFAVFVFGIYAVSHVLNFMLIWGYLVAAEGRTWKTGFTDVYTRVLGVEGATSLLVVGVAWMNVRFGPGATVLAGLVVLLFQWMLRTALQAFERGEELEVRNRQLAALQFGLISTTMKTLNLRDHMTARHSAAVARYAREMARELGLSTREQELFHTAGLFHDIGKFIFPDSILLANTPLTDDQYEIVRRHPEVGAELIAEIEGYGPIAEIVRSHHERIDGRGYPDRLSGDDIPLGARVLAVADVYDVITARDTYRSPVSQLEAFTELRRSAGTQLDAALVELFIDLVSNRGLAFRHSSEADFEAELSLERRVSDYAAPRVPEPAKTAA
jgi:putative nucleotidyltransferase with HDIG domain